MITHLRRLNCFFLLLTLSFIGQVNAQECEHLGVISRGFLLGKFNCDVVILSSDGADIFQPNDLPDNFQAGDFIRFSYDVLDSTACSDNVPLINISCIEPLFEPADSTLITCNFDITSTILSDTLGITTYQLEVYNPTDFGDYHPQSVTWYEYETGKEIGDEPVIVYSATENSPLGLNVCADITVQLLDNELCATTLCHNLVPENIIPSLETCQALFVYQPQDQLSENGTIDFYNLSFGTYSQAIWDFGDGQKDTINALTHTYTYSMPGLYEVCLEIQDTNGCASSFCLPIFTVGGDEICNYNECVFPGDANKDGTVDIFDALNLGVGFNATGEVRPNAVIDPILQAAFNWDINTIFNLNFKHIDCNGDGIVNEQDFKAIDQNYVPITSNKTFVPNTALPEVSLDFMADTLFFNPNQEFIEIPAKLIVGETSKEIDDLYGVAVAFDYDNTAVTAINTAYLSNTFFSNTAGTVFAGDKYLRNERQYGVAITRTDQKGVAGAGDIATVSFILELDILEGRTQVLELDIKELKPIDADGEEIPVSVPNDSPKVVLIFDENLSVNTEEILPESQFQVYPNPATDFLMIDVAKNVDLKDNQVIIFNTLGEKVATQSLTQPLQKINISQLPTGVYWVKIYTEEGIGIKEIIKR